MSCKGAHLGVLHVDVAPLRLHASVRVSETDGKDCTKPKGSSQRYWLRLVAHAATRVAALQVGPHWTTTHAVSVIRAMDTCGTIGEVRERLH